jgi:phosphoribosylanthranilate isomerase
VWVKICANTNLEDAERAAELGADAVGFVFAPSKRQVTAAVVAQITPYLPRKVERIGVFPAWSAQAIIGAVQEAGLTAVQLHGEVSLDLIVALRESLGHTIRIIQAVPWRVADASSEAAVVAQLKKIQQQGVTDRVLVDSQVGPASGGMGVAFDWAAARTVFQAHRAAKLILAGGLTPDNVGAAILQLEPWGVDVASGVEAMPGRKDAEKLSRFIRAAKQSGSAPDVKPIPESS